MGKNPWRKKWTKAERLFPNWNQAKINAYYSRKEVTSYFYVEISWCFLFCKRMVLRALDSTLLIKKWVYWKHYSLFHAIVILVSMKNVCLFFVFLYKSNPNASYYCCVQWKKPPFIAMFHFGHAIVQSSQTCSYHNQVLFACYHSVGGHNQCNSFLC